MLVAMAMHATPHGFAGCYRVTIERPSMAGDIGNIQAETLILVGEHDVHYLDDADMMEQRIPSSRKLVVPGVGHAMSIQAPERFSDEVLSFLAQTQAHTAKPSAR